MGDRITKHGGRRIRIQPAAVYRIAVGVHPNIAETGFAGFGHSGDIERRLGVVNRCQIGFRAGDADSVRRQPPVGELIAVRQFSIKMQANRYRTRAQPVYNQLDLRRGFGGNGQPVHFGGNTVVKGIGTRDSD
ncbi:hypothetical protein SDC9_183413 [bioreactor metagenome]|uniref:Uncharacterized protein n=1 Tax=bioreactor metagenome TaxID=1076179 RepID=A0A645HB18_9ZZZZ